jgi:hypothetical protein
MASNSNCDPHTPPRDLEQKEFDTIKRSRFFRAFDTKQKGDSLAGICKQPDISIAPSTGRKWLKQRETLGSPAKRRTRKISTRIGRPTKVSEEVLDRVIDPNDPLNDKPYETIIEELGLNISAHAFQQAVTKRRGAKRYKKPKSKGISKINKKKRVKYGQEHKDETITGFWQWIWFTDEAHFNSKDLVEKAEYSLRQPGAETRFQSINEAPESQLDVTLHVAGGICYDNKGDLIFYNDPIEPETHKELMATRPRKSGVETDTEHQQKVEEWKASLPPKRSSGNSMTMKHYAQHILPHHIEAVKAMEKRSGRSCWLQEDNDGSHGTRSPKNVASDLKKASHIQCLLHPAQSPDLNPIEGIWLIIKQRLRGGSWQTVAEFKEAIVREWRRITQAQIRRRISEMPKRCRILCSNEGARIKSDLW